MSMMLNTTAGTIRAILAFIDPNNTPKIAYDDDSLAIPLINKLKENLGDKDGSQSVFISFGDDEENIKNQFNGICKNIESIFNHLAYYSQKNY